MSVERVWTFANVWSQIKQISMSNFDPLEVGDHGNETQLKVGANLNFNRFKG